MMKNIPNKEQAAQNPIDLILERGLVIWYSDMIIILEITST